MAEHPHTTPPASRRRTLFAAAGAVIMGSGITAGAAASMADLMPLNPDAELLALRAELTAAVADVSYDENRPEWNDERLTQSAERLIDACWAIVDAPPAQTPAGLALKAAAAMYQLRDGYNYGGWDGDGEAMAWNLLSELAGDSYVAPILPTYLRANSEPARA